MNFGLPRHSIIPRSYAMWVNCKENNHPPEGTNRRRVMLYNGMLSCYTLDEKNKLLKVQVNKEKLDKVDTTMLVGSYICESIYGLEEDRYMLYYYENLKILVDLEVMKEKPE